MPNNYNRTIKDLKFLERRLEIIQKGYEAYPSLYTELSNASYSLERSINLLERIKIANEV